MRLFWIGFWSWPAIIAITVSLNWYRITIRKKKPYYFASNWSRGVFGFACLVLMTVKDGFDPAYLSTWLPAIPPIMYILSSFGLFFDPGLNIARGKEIDYEGKDSGWFDSLKKPLYYLVKAACAAGLVVSLKMIFS